MRDRTQGSDVGRREVGECGLCEPITDGNSPKNQVWHISVAVFATPAQAAAATARLNAGQKGCPTTKTNTDGKDLETITRTLAIKYKVGAWTGYRTISHLTGAGAAAH